jgi:elongation factor P
MLNYNQITTGTVIVFNDEPHKVLSHRVFRVQSSKPQNVTKLKSLVSGKVVDQSFHQSDKVEEAELDKKPIVFIYAGKDEYMFHEAGDPSKRFPLSEELIGPGVAFLKPNSEYQAVLFDEDIIGVEIPIKMQLRVKEAPPAVKGNTAQGATKTVELETGATVNTPLFVNTGDLIEVNTETGEYASRIEKA